MIHAVVGRPGEGKGIAMVTLGYEMAYVSRMGKWLGKERRPLYATFACDGAIPLLDQRDIVAQVGDGQTWGALRAVVLVDEQGISADARNTLNLDPLQDAAWRLHRKTRVDLIYAAQHLSQVDKRCRDLTHEVIFVHRVGPDGGQAAAEHKRVSWWRRPWWFKLTAYSLGDLDQNTWEPRPGAGKRWSRRLGFDARIASAYNTNELVYPATLAPALKQLQAGAAGRLALPPYRVVGGISQPRELAAGQAFVILEAMGAKADWRRPLGQLTSDEPAVREILERMEIYRHGDLPVPAGDVVAQIGRGDVVEVDGVIVAAARAGRNRVELVLRLPHGRHGVAVGAADLVPAEDVSGRRCVAMVRLSGSVAELVGLELAS